MPEIEYSQKHKAYLRDLAKKQLEYAKLPIMQQRRDRWVKHNAMEPGLPMLVMETRSFAEDILPEAKCDNPALIQIERQLLSNIVNHELIDDDKVIPDYFTVHWDITFRLFDLDIQRHSSGDKNSKDLGMAWAHPITDITTQCSSLKPSYYAVDKTATLDRKHLVEDLIGDILPVRIENNSLEWVFAPTAHIVFLMGMEYMFMTLMDQPKLFSRLASRVVDDLIGYLRWQEKEGLLSLNNENHYAGAGSYGFTHELPVQKQKGAAVTARDLWGNMNSQETVGLSPSMYRELIFPHYQRLAGEFGLVYYGCCEPVHDHWDNCISKLANLRKVSVSPWCDEQSMGQKLAAAKVIYSRKPNPIFIGVDDFNEQGYREHIKATLKAAKGCILEIIHRDIYTLNGDKTRAGKAIKIARELIRRNADLG